MNYPLYNDKLAPIWNINEDGAKLDADIRKQLLKIAMDFVKELKDNGINIKMEDVILLGSITNYNWTPYSDVDMHIVADYGSLDMDKDTAQTMFDAIKTNWNSKHDIKMKGYDVELYVQDKDHVAHSASEYSVLRDEWNKEPVKEKPNFNKELIKKKYSEYKKKTENILANKDEKALKDLLEKLYKFRQAGLDKGGELSEENIVFKILRAKGYLDKIKDGVAKIYDKKMSVKETDSQITLSGGGYRLDVQRVANKILDYAKEHGEYPDVNPLFNALVTKYNKNIDDVHDDVNRAFRKLNSILIEKEK